MANVLIPAGAEQPNVLHALTRKRAQLAGQIEHHKCELNRLTAELEHIDASIRIFNSDIDVTAIRSKPFPPPHRATTGEVTSTVFDVLREAGSPVSSREIAVQLMQNRGLNIEDPMLLAVMTKRVGACLRNNRQKGFVRAIARAGDQGWELLP